jgi:sulfide:quinone oxidoreductase
MNRSKRVIVLGAGIAGTAAADTLRRLLPASHEVVLIEKAQEHVFSPSLLWLAVGRRSRHQITRPMIRMTRKGIRLVAGTIEKIDARSKVVVVDGQDMEGDALVVALGADYDLMAIPGLQAGGHNLYSLEGADSLRNSLSRFETGTFSILTATPAYKCPAAPYEAAMLVESHLRERKIRSRVQMEFWAAEPGPMGVAGPVVSAAVKAMIESRGIVYRPGRQIREVDAAARRLVFADGSHANYDILAYVPPHTAPSVVREAGLVGASGWISVDRLTLETAHAGVYAVGDITSIPLSLGKPLPKAGTFAEGQGRVAAMNIVHTLTARGRPASFAGHGECLVETGGATAAYGGGNFYGEPLPQVALKRPARFWHLAKIMVERRWLRRWS